MASMPRRRGTVFLQGVGRRRGGAQFVAVRGNTVIVTLNGI